MNNNEKIIHLVFPGPIAGTEKVILTGTHALLRQGQRVEIWVVREIRVPHIADEFIQQATNLKIETKVFNCYQRLDLKLLQQLNKTISAENIKVIHAHGIKACVYSNFLHVVNVCTFHGQTSHTLVVKFYELLELIAIKRSKHVIAVSTPMQNWLRQKGIEKDKISIVENPLSIEKNSLNFNTIENAHKNEKTNSSLELISLGRLSQEKGIQDLLIALSDHNSPFHLTIVGDGDQRSHLYHLCEQLSILKNVSFVGNQLKIMPFLQRADVFMMPSHREGLPLALIEACCIGLPVIASDVGAISEIVKDNINGILHEAKNINQILNSLERFRENKKILRKNARLMANEFRDRFSTENWAKKTISIYNMVFNQL